MNKKIEQLFVEYGKIAFVVWFVIFGLTLVGFAMAIEAGFEVKGVAATAGVWTAAYVASKFTLPIRIVATAAVTPLVGRLLRRGKAS
ncbi:MAG: hypothetical protein AAF654_14685 [Myxococcota bacterium]